jgi:hypothetical protein
VKVSQTIATNDNDNDADADRTTVSFEDSRPRRNPLETEERARNMKLSMKLSWYASIGTESTRGRGQVPVQIAGSFLAMLLGCATPATGSGGSAGGEPIRPALLAGPAPALAEPTAVSTAGARCTSDGCTCRGPGEDEAEEKSPPLDGSKRFELRLSAPGGRASLDLTGIGTIAVSGAGEKCVYVDMPSGGTHDVRLVALESVKGGGVSPILKIAEYGPKGPYWYDVLAVRCGELNSDDDVRCDRAGADAWAVRARQRKRGRLDPCGSSVITGLAWETSGGQAERDGGLFRDFTVRFTMEVKKFATQFAPGSTECVPK